jgi:hypothetical protein
LLTPYLPPDTKVQAGILCTNDTLYQGIVVQYLLKDGHLSGIILHQPKRFARESYLAAKAQGGELDKREYWTPISSQNLFFFADKIFNMNLSCVVASGKAADPASVEKFLAEEFSPLEKGLGKLTVSVEKESSTRDRGQSGDGSPSGSARQFYSGSGTILLSLATCLFWVLVRVQLQR